jgi:hypothetical protein
MPPNDRFWMFDKNMQAFIPVSKIIAFRRMNLNPHEKSTESQIGMSQIKDSCLPADLLCYAQH